MQTSQQHDAVSRQHFDEAMSGLRREIDSVDTNLRREIEATDKRLERVWLLHVEAHRAEHMHVDTAVQRMEAKIDMLLDTRMREGGRDMVVGRIITVALAILTTVVAALILRAL